MAGMEVFDAASAAEPWHAALIRLPVEQQDIYFMPGYGSAYVSSGEERCLLFKYEDAGELWLHPFLMRKIPAHLPTRGNAEWYDIESAYGYAGPLASTDDDQFLNRATASFDDWCQRSGVVAEFVRLHPLLDNGRWQSKKAEIVVDRKTVSLDLGGAKDEPLPISKNGRDMVRKAEKSGLVVECRDDDRSFAGFFELYRQTMRRLDADNYYYFDDRHFEALAKLVKNSGWLITATSGGRMLAGGLFLYGRKWMHYHLSASDPDNRMPGATNAVLFHAAKIGKAANLEKLHLGGGTTAEDTDNLLAFKRKMANEEHRFSFTKRIHNLDIYDELTSWWRRTFPDLALAYGNRLLCYRYGVPDRTRTNCD